MKMNLLIDIGNSRAKLCLSSDLSQVFKKKSYEYKKNTFREDFSRIFKSYSSEFLKPGEVTAIGISVTNPVLKEILKEKFKKSNTVFVDNRKSPFVKITYKNKLGNDRVCSVNAAYRLYKKKQMLVIDFGTATTLNMVINGEFTGGAISPGIRTGLNSLSGNTSLPKSDIKFDRSIIFDNTRDSISGGTTNQTLFYIETAVAKLKKKYRELFVIATGGLAEPVAPHTGCIDIVDRDLVLKGLGIILNYYSSKK